MTNKYSVTYHQRHCGENAYKKKLYPTRPLNGAEDRLDDHDQWQVRQVKPVRGIGKISDFILVSAKVSSEKTKESENHEPCIDCCEKTILHK